MLARAVARLFFQPVHVAAAAPSFTDTTAAGDCDSSSPGGSGDGGGGGRNRGGSNRSMLLAVPENVSRCNGLALAYKPPSSRARPQPPTAAVAPSLLLWRRVPRALLEACAASHASELGTAHACHLATASAEACQACEAAATEAALHEVNKSRKAKKRVNEDATTRRGGRDEDDEEEVAAEVTTRLLRHGVTAAHADLADLADRWRGLVACAQAASASTSSSSSSSSSASHGRLPSSSGECTDSGNDASGHSIDYLWFLRTLLSTDRAFRDRRSARGNEGGGLNGTSERRAVGLQQRMAELLAARKQWA